MHNIVKSALVYFTIVFTMAFAMGIVRVLVLIPRIGALPAVLIELPLLLTVSWLVCRRVTTRWAVPARTGPRLKMGLLAFSILMITEAVMSVWLFGRPFDAFLADLFTLTGILGLTGQMLFGLIPWIQKGSQTASPSTRPEQL